MLPLSLDLTKLRVALIGKGEEALRRFGWLMEAGASSVIVFSETPSPALAAAATPLQRRWPEPADFAGIRLVFIADLEEPQRSAMAETARAAGALIHVEDVPQLCDVHAPSVLRRGDLTIAVSTNGAAPGLAAELKQYLAGLFGPEWQGRVEYLKTLRRYWHAQGTDHATIRRLTATRIARRGWLHARRNEAVNDPGKAIHERGGG
jgi:precorrin-2 dehydrogenase / sirohydrochlorin ferrochelatase